jgi:hypothetical protein
LLPKAAKAIRLVLQPAVLRATSLMFLKNNLPMETLPEGRLLGYLVFSYLFQTAIACNCSEIACVNTPLATHQLRGRFVEQNLELSSVFGCDQSHKCQGRDFGHTLSRSLSQT